MDKPDIFMPLYIGDYLAGTSRLTTELHGAYMLLIMDYWMNGPLPNNDAMLASITRMSPDAWSNARACLEHFFSIDEASWKHKRIEQELASAYEKKRVAKERAEAAAKARWEKQRAREAASNKNATSNAASNTQAVLEECPSPPPPPSPITTTDVVVTPPPKIPHHQSLIDNWQPSPATIEALTQLHRIPSQFISEQLVEFKTYWRDRADSKTSWDAAFLKRCPQQWKSYGAEWRRVADDEFLDKHTDKSWAEGL
tara:strand:- start:1589 stop:2353 length:765 start_codon:yes stop_codon:yes gene_type:complete